MNIELRFLQKAFTDENYISFSFKNKSYNDVKILNIKDTIFTSDAGIFDINKITKLIILKQRYTK